MVNRGTEVKMLHSLRNSHMDTYGTCISGIAFVLYAATASNGLRYTEARALRASRECWRCGIMEPVRIPFPLSAWDRQIIVVGQVFRRQTIRSYH